MQLVSHIRSPLSCLIIHVCMYKNILQEYVSVDKPNKGSIQLGAGPDEEKFWKSQLPCMYLLIYWTLLGQFLLF